VEVFVRNSGDLGQARLGVLGINDNTFKFINNKKKMNKKTIISTASRLFAALTLLLFLSTASIEAQVTIGKLAEPHNAAILDLSQVESQNLGLLLPHVKLTGLTPFQLLPPDQQKEIDATGMVVYNEAHVDNDVYPGISVWDGEKWGRINDGTTPPLLPFTITTSGAACGNGVLFSIPEDYPDWSNATKFVWSLTVSPAGYTPATITSGSKNSHFFVPYDATERTYEVSVYAEGSKQRSITCTGSQKGRLNASSFSIDGADCYDIAKTDYVYNKEDASQYETRYGVLAKRVQLTPSYDYSYSVIGTGNNPTYLWSVSDPGGTLLSSSDGATVSSINIQFRPEVLSDTWLIDHPTNEHIVVLTCLVTDGSCTYVVSKEIKVGDRDCCTGLRDIEGIIYTAVRFGDAGCWMSENLAVTRNQKLGSAANLATNDNASQEYAPRYTRPKVNDTSFISLEDAQNSNYFSSFGTNIGKPGLLYNWAAAVGATSSDEAQGGNYDNYTASNITHPASKATSKDEDICPVGWYLPTDAEWYALENEIDKNRNKYSSASGTGSGNVPINTGSQGSHGQYMRAVDDVPRSAGSYSDYVAGSSNPKESGFSGLLVGYAGRSSWGNYGIYTYYWSSSSSFNSGTGAWRRSLHFNSTGVHRDGSNKYQLFSVRCKKLD
jgi:uncharacterized protein (TIGR02145 family)